MAKAKTVWYRPTCPNCNQLFSTKYKKKMFCSDKCRMDYWMKTHPRISL